MVYSTTANLGVFLRKYTVEDSLGHRDTCGANKEIAVITLEPEGKASFGYSCMQTRLMDQYNRKWPISFVSDSKRLITVIRAIQVKRILHQSLCTRKLRE